MKDNNTSQINIRITSTLRNLLFWPNNSMPIWAAKETLPVGLNIRWKTALLLRERIILIYPQKMGNIQELKGKEADLAILREKSEQL
jgi:hypothetical protein